MKFFTRIKEFSELAFWRFTKWRSGQLTNTHYKAFFTDYFSLTDEFYERKTILDIGCGPRGSLEWANMAQERIGLDPLANSYLKMGANKHQMKYVQAYVEEIPYPDDYFDVVSAFNALDHVENLTKSSKEIVRVIKPGGVFLLIVDIHNYKTLTEPQKLNWDLIDEHFRQLEKIIIKRLKSVAKNRIYTNVRAQQLLDDGHVGNGVLTAILKKPD